MKYFLFIFVCLISASSAEYYTVIKQEGRKVTIDGNMGELKPGQKLFIEGTSIPVKVIGFKDEMTIIEVPPTGMKFQSRERISIINPKATKKRTENELNGSDLSLTEPIFQETKKKESFTPRKNISALNYLVPQSDFALISDVKIQNIKYVSTQNSVQRKLISGNIDSTEMSVGVVYGFNSKLNFGVSEGYLLNGTTKYKNEVNNSFFPESNSKGVGNPSLLGIYRIYNVNDGQYTDDIGLRFKPRLIKLKSPDTSGSKVSGNNGDASNYVSLFNRYTLQNVMSELTIELNFDQYFKGEVETGSNETYSLIDPYSIFSISGEWRVHFVDFYIGPMAAINFPFNVTTKFTKSLNPSTVTDIYNHTFLPGFVVGYDVLKNASLRFQYIYANYDVTQMLGLSSQTVELSNNFTNTSYTFGLDISF